MAGQRPLARLGQAFALGVHDALAQAGLVAPESVTEAFATPRHVWWNFVSSRPERIEQAKRDWREGRFPTIPGDDQEFIPVPEKPLTISYP